MTTATTNQPAAPAVAPMTRREFLYYIWFASIALFAAQGGLATLWFAYPRFKEGTFGGVFDVPISDVPRPDASPQPFSGGRFWLVNLGDKSAQDPRGPQEWYSQKGVKALYMICVHLGCLYSWIPNTDRFECPCHGSKYLANGTTIAGPATRNLDVFYIEALDAEGKVIDRTEIGPNNDPRAINIEGAARLRVDTGKRLPGAPNPNPREIVA